MRTNGKMKKRFSLKAIYKHITRNLQSFHFRSRHYFDILTQYEVTYFIGLLILMSGLTISAPGCGVRWLRRLSVLQPGDSLLVGNRSVAVS